MNTRVTVDDVLRITGTCKREGKEFRAGCLICYHGKVASAGSGMTFRDGDKPGAGVVFHQHVCTQHTSEDLILYVRERWDKNRPPKKNAPAGTGAQEQPITRAGVDGDASTPSAGDIVKDIIAQLGKRKTWVYLKSDGTPDIQVTRYDSDGPNEKKTFSQAHWDNGKLIHKKKPGAQPLYRWDKIHDSTAPVYIHEGEKAADAAAERNPHMAVTTWPGGSGAVLKADWQLIAGRDVILRPDADEPGIKAMKSLAQKLQELGCSVRMVDVSQLMGTGNDEADPEPDGISYADMLAKAKPAHGIEIIPTTQICATVYPERKWVVRDLLPEGLAMLSAAPKVGKTLFATNLAACVASGRPFLGYHTTQGSVLYIDLEADDRGIKHRLKSLGWDQGVDEMLIFTPPPGWQLTLENLNHLDSEIRTKIPRLGLVVIDTLELAIPHPEKTGAKNSYQIDVERLTNLRAWAQRRQVSVILIHHTRKNPTVGEVYDATSGSRGLTATVEIPMLLKREDGNKFILAITSRYTPSVELLLERTGVKWELIGEPALASMTDDQQQIYDYIQSNPGSRPRDIHQAIGIPAGTVNPLLRRMTQKGILRTPARGKYEITPIQEDVINVISQQDEKLQNYKNYTNTVKGFTPEGDHDPF